MLRQSLLFIPHDDPDARRWMVALWGYCMRRGLKPEAVAHDWCDVLKLWVPGKRVVVARRDHVGWLDVVSEERERRGPTPPPEQRRPRRA